MPRLLNRDDSEAHIGSVGSFSYSGIRPDLLNESNYTIVTIICDVSGSVYGFKDQLLAMVKAVVESCKKSPRVDKLLLRYVTFNDVVQEQHGFLPLNDVDVSAYKDLDPHSMTALFDASYSGVGAANTFAKEMYDKRDVMSNAITFVITDGGESGASVMSAKDVKNRVVEATQRDEYLESHITILIGINVSNQGAKKKLEEFKNDANFTQYIDAGMADEKTLAKLANFVSRSISAQSSSLGSGGASAPLTF